MDMDKSYEGFKMADVVFKITIKSLDTLKY